MTPTTSTALRRALFALACTTIAAGCRTGDARASADPYASQVDAATPADANAARDDAASWCEAAVVERDGQPCVTYRARLSGAFLVVEALHAPGWHSYAMDNAQRVAAALDGRPSLGAELPTNIEVEGCEVVSRWHQSRPDDLSQPELMWFTWGFRDRATFAVRIADPSPELLVTVRGQVCNDATCAGVDVGLELTTGNHRIARAPALDELLEVAAAPPATTEAPPTPQEN